LPAKSPTKFISPTAAWWSNTGRQRNSSHNAATSARGNFSVRYYDQAGISARMRRPSRGDGRNLIELLFPLVPCNIPIGEQSSIRPAISFDHFVDQHICCSFPRTQIRAYRWCSRPRIGRAIMSPNRSIGRVRSATEPAYLIPGPHATRVP
jgi:hypothetical protein